MVEWIIAKVSAVLRRYWVTLMLFSMLIAAMTYSLDAANWVKEDSVLVEVFVVGIVLGWMLATSRFRGVFVALYTLVMGAAVVVEAQAKVLPGLVELLFTPFGALIEEMNLRAFSFYLRVTGWVATLQSGEALEDTGLFVLVLGYLLLLAAVWLMWSMVRKRQMLNGLLPVGLMFAINVHLSRQAMGTYLLFLFPAILLIVRTNFNRRHEDWQNRQVDYPDQLGLEWGMSALALAVVIILAARAAPMVGTREGLQMVSEWLEKTRERTAETTDRLFAGVRPPPPPVDEIPPLYVNTPNMGEIGSPIPQGIETIMWVRVSDPPPIPPEIGINVPAVVTRIHYWRSGIYDVYTGRGWQPAAMAGEIQPQNELSSEPPAGRYFLRQEYTLEARHSGALFSVNDPMQTDEDVYLRRANIEPSHLLEGQVDAYQVISLATDVSANQLDEAGTEYPPDIAAQYLQLADTLPERVRSLAVRVGGGAETPYRKALRVQSYLRENFPYDLNVAPSPERRDVVDHFLFESQRGFCSHYATTMAVMMRALGVPARVATGYAMGDWVQDEQAFRVPVAAAHAWVEVYFPGYGWIEFEPTAYRELIIYPEEAPIRTAQEPVQIEPKPEREARPYMIAVLLAGALALLVLPFLLMRMFTTPRSAPSVRADILYRRMRRALGWAGLAAEPSTTPDEYLALYGARLAGYNHMERALRQATDIYREMIYSPHPPDQRRVRSASLLWQQSLNEWVKLFARFTWKRIREKNSG